MKWCRDLFGVSRLFVPLRVRLELAATVILCLALIFGVLITIASRDVRRSAYCVVGYELLGALWLAGALGLFPFFGVSPRDDAIERKNSAALSTVNGALVGVAACFGGANAGNGPGPGAVIFCAVLASAGFFLLWFLIDLAGSRWTDAITIDRNHGAGFRLGGLLLAIGLALGSSVTGDWVSAEGAARDFVQRSWPVVPVLCIALLSEARLRRSPKDNAGWPTAAAYVGITVCCMAVERRIR